MDIVTISGNTNSEGQYDDKPAPVVPAAYGGQREFIDNLSATDDLFYYQPTNQSALVGSVVLHAAVFLLLVFTWKTTYQGAALLKTASGGIVLVQNDGEKPEYFQEASDKSDLQEESLSNDQLISSSTAGQRNAPSSNAELPGGLPDQSIAGLDGVASNGEVTLPSLEELTGSRPTRAGSYGAVKTGIFGITGMGSRFVYVFDRSGSMAGYGGRPMAAAKQQLVASVMNLKENHQFQVIFYNERPILLNPISPAQPTLLYGTAANLEYVQDFMQQIKPDGQTNHTAALTMALNLNPDVIFFLTDADEPQLTTAELNRITRRNNSIGAAINAIQFGIGRRGDRHNFLLQLARENGGQYAYVDLKQLAPIR